MTGALWWAAVRAAGYEGAQPRLIKVLERLTMQREREVAPEYLYYGIPSPWLQVRFGWAGGWARRQEVAEQLLADATGSCF